MVTHRNPPRRHRGRPQRERAPPRRPPDRALARFVVLLLGALVFLFPFYYMLIGSLQTEPDTSLAGAFPTGGMTLDNYAQIN